ncbi:hypothetical protein LEL_01851 [Akanthomyces lecanii RCEF 1005]|uniref:Uncharacterized protein n=1 Tax=Akanthomyces lecanii RCEF 1005 TaxID=1081108 RepID=A0A162KPV5_CORDF|nr:hypothetical protein LEL_01851 [Akanthomyces lecanii RCEF 1005]
MADLHSPPSNTMHEIVNAVTTVIEDKRMLCISFVLLGAFFGFLICIVGIDMLAKYRSGELRDDLRGDQELPRPRTQSNSHAAIVERLAVKASSPTRL